MTDQQNSPTLKVWRAVVRRPWHADVVLTVLSQTHLEAVAQAIHQTTGLVVDLSTNRLGNPCLVFPNRHPSDKTGEGWEVIRQGTMVTEDGEWRVQVDCQETDPTWFVE